MTLFNFKEGDRVECIRGKGGSVNHNLEEGEICIIEKAYNDGFVRLEGNPFVYNSSRFELVENAKPTEKESGLEAFLINNLYKIEFYVLQSAKYDKLGGYKSTADNAYEFYDELQRLKKDYEDYFDELD